MNLQHVNVIGAGFAGIECALALAKRGLRVHVFNVPMQACSCDGYEIFGQSKQTCMLQEKLRKETRALGSVLIDEEERLNHLQSKKCNADKVIEYGIKLIKQNKNIDYFELAIHELNLKEVNVVATGHNTLPQLMQYFQDMFGSMKVFNFYKVFPCITSDNLEEKLYCLEDKYFLPLSYEEYIKLCNCIIKERNNAQITENINDLIENIVIKGKDALKNQCMKEVFLPCERPYAVLHLNKLEDGFEICDFCSGLCVQAQERIIRSIKGLENVILLNAGKPIVNSYLNSPIVINEFGQAQKIENLFFAGNIAGLVGHVEGMASGLNVAKNVLAYINGKVMTPPNKESVYGQLIDKLFAQSAINFKPIMANYDILKSREGL